VIVARDLYREYAEGERRVRALNGLNLDIGQGEFVSVTGPSGCGKTTLLQILGALDTPTSGEIRVADMSLGSATEAQRNLYRRRDVGIVFQFFNLLPTLTVAENIGLPLRLAGTGGDAIAERIDELLPQIGLEDRATHLPHQLSGGEMQRVALARALAHRPRLLLADEPTGNLDSTTATRVMELISSVHGSTDLTLVMVTHSEEVASMADRRIRLLDGQLENDSG